MAVFRQKPPSLVIKGEKGRGSYGTVCHGELEGEPVMIKRIHEILLTSSRSDQLRKFEQECQILETLHHPNIVRSLGAFWDDATREPLLVMQPMKENLRDYLERRKQADAKLSVDDHLSITLSIAEGLKFLHDQNQPIAHRDLNDKNILVGEDGSVKIGDFGQSTLLAGSTEYMATMAPGAFVFMPPEALMDEPHYNLKVDSFSMGVLMLEISTQMPPPARMSNIGSTQEVERRSKDLTLLDSCHPLKPLIIWCLQNQYKLRPDVATIHSQLMTLKHPELQQKVEELQTGLREAELHSLQLEGTLQKSNEQMEVLKADNKNLETELEVTKEKVLKRTLDLEEQNRTLEQWKNENKQLEEQLKSSRDRESQLMLQLRQTERALVDKQALQEELTRRLCQKDEEIAVLSSENEAMASYARDSLRKLQEIKTAVDTVRSAVDKIDENCTKSGKRDKNDENNVPENRSLAVDSFTSLNPTVVQLMRRLKLFDATHIQCSEDFTTVNVVGEKEAATKAGDVFINLYQDFIYGQKIITEIVRTNNLPEDQYALLLSEIEAQHPEVLCQPQYSQQSMVLSALEQPKLAKAKRHIVSFSPGKQLPVVPPRPTHTTPQPTSLRDASLLLPNGRMLTVKRGDLLKEKVTAIVNAANDRLNHIGGVAFAIDRASGGNVQRESSNEVKQRMPPGTAQKVIPVARSPDVVEIPLEKTHRKMVIKKAHFVFEDADIKVAAICSELGFATGSNKELDGYLKGQLSEAVRVRYQYRRPDKFDVFTVHVQHASISCRYLVIVNILNHSLGTRHNSHKYLQQIVQAVCQEADTLEMPSVAIAPNTFTVGGFQKGSILPEFIQVINQFRFINDGIFTDVCFLANQNDFNSLVADAERTVGRVLRRTPQLAKVANQLPTDSSHPSSSPQPPAPVVGGAPVTPPAPVVGGAPVTPPGSGMGSSKDTQLPSPGPGVTKLSEHVFFALVCGDLCKVQADAVVVPVAPSLDLKSGVVQAVDAASGGATTRAVKQIKQTTKQTVLEGTAIPVAITSGLNCKHAILMIRNAKGKSEDLDHACNKALKLAEVLSSNKCKAKLAGCMTGAFASFLPQNPQYTVMVTVVVRENDEDTLKAFRSCTGVGATDWGMMSCPDGKACQ